MHVIHVSNYMYKQEMEVFNFEGMNDTNMTDVQSSFPTGGKYINIIFYGIIYYKWYA